MTVFVYGVLIVIGLWLLIMTAVVFRLKRHYNNLISRTKKRKIDEILDSLIEKDIFLEAEFNEVKKTIQEIIYEQKFHLQKVGFLRFNPFDRIGGEQSFIIALLNKENSGIILNFFYTREGIRVYAKKVNESKSEEYELSNEEKEVIKKAK